MTISTTGPNTSAFAQPHLPPAGASSVPSSHVVTIVKGAQFASNGQNYVPDILTVRSGSDVTFVNHDSVTHTAVSGTPKNGTFGYFYTGLIKPGQNSTVKITGQSGTAIPYFCKIHPHMRGVIRISEMPAQAAQPTQNQNQQQNPVNTPLLTKSQINKNSIGTFTASGSIASWASSPSNNNTGEVPIPYVISGPWTLKVVNGTANSFSANLTMVKADGTGIHRHQFSNFRVENANFTVTALLNSSRVLSPLEIAGPQSSISIPGQIDITTNDTKTWTNISINIMIRHWHAINIVTDESATGKHFSEGHYAPSIYGIVSSIQDNTGKELMDQNGNLHLAKAM